MNRQMKRGFVKALLLSMLVTLSITIAVVSKANSNIVEKEAISYHYELYEIMSGDTLTSIADEYKPDCMKRNDYIQEICEINTISVWSVLYAGNYLLLKVYDT